MASFVLKLKFKSIVDASIEPEQCWLFQTTDTDITDSLFDWLEEKKHNNDASVELITSGKGISDLFLAHKYYKTLRFRFPKEESPLYYYQQRYHATENDSVQTLRDYLGLIGDPYYRRIALQLGLDKLLDEKINMLSTGEFRKAAILKSVMTGPQILFLEEPYAGLDPAGIRLLNNLFLHLMHYGTSIVIFSSSAFRPEFITHFVRVGDSEATGGRWEPLRIEIPETIFDTDFDSAFELKRIVARYDGRDILHNVSWSVRRNEKWSLTGPNGAGKSTLLSFVYADNPQVYSNDVKLFGRPRGSGETIWEVKDRIGFYSSEMHRYFDKMQSADAAISSIVFQNPYEKRILSSGEQQFRHQLMAYFDLGGIGNSLLSDLPAVTQKLVILTGVLLKNSPLVILDEPFQGFSDKLLRQSLAIIEKYVENRTFILVSHKYTDIPGCVNRHFHIETGIGREIAKLPA